MGSFIMVQLREESRQCMWQTGSLAERVRSIKLLGYHYIQQNQRRLLNRLTYLLLEGLVDLCANNALLRPHGHPAQLVEEYIELLMQEKVEGRGGQGRPVNNGKTQIYQREYENYQRRVEELLKKNAGLEGSVRLLEEKSGKQVRTIQKMRQKYTAISELMFEVRQNHEKEIQNILKMHKEEVQALNAKSTVVNQQLIRTKAHLELLQNQKGILCYSPKQSNQFFNSSCQTEITLTTADKPNMDICSIISLNFIPQQTNLLIRKELQFIVEPIKKSVTLNHAFNLCHEPFPKTKLHQQSQTASQMNNCMNQTQVSALKSSAYEEQNLQLQQELSTLGIICDQAQRQSKSLRLKLASRDEQYIQLGRHYNNLQERHDKARQEWQRQKEQAQLITKSLKEECERLSILNRQMERNMLQMEQTMLQFSSSCQLVRQEKEQGLGSSCDHTDESTTPRKRQDSLPIQHISDFIQPSLDQAYIRKETITKYLLQLLDKKCRGEEVFIIIQQISSCLDWHQEQIDKIREYARKSRLKESPQLQEGLETRFYRFLTEQ